MIVAFPGHTRAHSAVCNVFGCRYMSDCRSRGHKLDHFYGHSPPFFRFKKGSCQLQAEVCTQNTGKLLSLACQGKKCVVRLTDHPDMTISVDWDIKNQTKKETGHAHFLFQCTQQKCNCY